MTPAEGLRYTDRQRVGGGRSSDVYRSVDQVSPGSKGVVALKVMSPDEDVPPHGTRREISLLYKINSFNNGKGHPNIIKILNSYDENTFDVVAVFPYYPYDLTQYVKLHSTQLPKRKFNPYLLDDSAQQQGSQTTNWVNNLSLEKAAKVLHGIADGLNFLHSNGIIHRDIKPENILFQNYEPNPVIIDFGICYQYPNNNGREDPNDKICDVSTGIYKAPELVFGISNYSYPIDIWSLGIVSTILYSTNAEPALDNDGYGDIRLVSLLFTTFGHPDLESWPEARLSKTFQTLQKLNNDRKSTEEIIPRADSTIKTLFEKMMVYESSSRITAADILAYLV